MQVSPEKIYELLQYCAGFAQEMLNDVGEFLPFGAVLNQDTELSGVGLDLAEQPDNMQLYKILVDTFSKQATNNEIQAAAIACDVNIPPEYESDISNGIRIHIETNDYARFFYVPYTIDSTAESEKVTLYSPITADVDPHIFQ